MTTGGNAGEMELRRIVAARYVSYGAILAAMTGLGLFFVAGVRDPSSWAAFSLASLVAVVVPQWVLSGPSDSVEHESSSPPELRALTSQPPPAPGETPPDRESGPTPDDVDYLRALRHEFRTPLNAVLGFSDVLLSGIDGAVNASQREDLEIIRASGIKLRILLDSALDISQLAGGELRLDTERVDIREVVSRAAQEAVQLWSNKRDAGCLLPDDPCPVEADEARLRRSILVLADFLATNHRDAEVTLSIVASHDHVAIEMAADTTERLTLDALPTTAEVLAAEDVTKIRQWPVAVTSELIGLQGGSLYHGSSPSRFLIRLPLGGAG